jgi:hypothetical protein
LSVSIPEWQPTVCLSATAQKKFYIYTPTVTLAGMSFAFLMGIVYEI